MIELSSNEYWGLRSGMINRMGERIFLVPRGGGTHQEHRGPSGWKLRKAPRYYANKKFARRGISLSMPMVKGVKRLDG